MYKIIGGDRQQYGPVSAEQLRQWIAEGRAGAQTLTQSEGQPEWRLLSTFPDFAAVLPRSEQRVPPVGTSLAAAQPLPPARRANGMATAGLVMGILSVTIGWLCCGPLFSVLGIIFSAVAISQINKHPLAQPGKGVAIAGLVLSIVGLIIAVAAIFAFGSLRVLQQLRWNAVW